MRLLCDVPLPPTMNPLGCARRWKWADDAADVSGMRSRFPFSLHLPLSPVLWRIWRYESSLSSSFLGTAKQKSERGGVRARVAGTREGVNIIAVPAHARRSNIYDAPSIRASLSSLLLRREKTVHRHDDALRGITMRIPAESWQICAIPTELPPPSLAAVQRRRRRDATIAVVIFIIIAHSFGF